MIKDDEKQSAIALLREIIYKEMDLDPDRVMIYNQKWNIPADDGIRVTLSFIGAKVFSVRADQDLDGDGNPTEVQRVNMQEMIQIDIMSKSTAALFRNWEVLAALASDRAQVAQEENNFKIALIPNDFKDMSEADGTARLYRFAITIVLHAWYATKAKAMKFYDTYQFEVQGEDFDTGPIDQPKPA